MSLVRIGDLELNYRLDGPTGAPVLILSNSLGTSLAMWDGLIGLLTSRYRVLRYDTRGHGDSHVADRSTSIYELAADIAGLCDALDIRAAHLVGLSLGGMTAQAFAIRYPERVTTLTLLGTSAHMPADWDERIATVRLEGMTSMTGVLSRWFTPDFASRSPETVDKVAAQLLATDPAGYAACCAAIRDMDLRAELAGIVAPTLIMVGSDDPATPPQHAEVLRSAIAGAELVVLPHAAHLLPVQRPRAVGSYLRAFLDRYDGSRERSPGGVSFQMGLENRKAVLGSEHVERSLASAGRFGMPWQDFITRTAWGEVWGDPTLPRNVRSLVTLAMMVALHREEEFKLHIRPALRNGVSIAELQALLLQSAIYAGVPAANAAFKWTREVLGEELD